MAGFRTGHQKQKPIRGETDDRDQTVSVSPVL